MLCAYEKPLKLAVEMVDSPRHKQQKKRIAKRLRNSVSKPWIHHPVVRKSMIHMPRRGRSWPGTYPVLLHYVVPLRCGWMKQHSGHRGSGVAWVHQGPSAWYSASPSPRWKIRWKRWMRMLYIPTIWWFYNLICCCNVWFVYTSYLHDVFVLYNLQHEIFGG